MKILLHLLKNNFIQLCRINQLRYGDSKKRRNTIYLFALVGAILIGLLAYLGCSLNIIFSLSWTLDDIITNLIVPMTLICLVLNIFIGVLWGSGLLLSDTNTDSVFALPIPLAALIISKLGVLYLIEVVLDIALLFPMTVLFGMTTGVLVPYYLLMAGMVLLFPILPSLLGTIVGTGVYYILRSSSALITRLKTIGAVLILFVFMTFMFWKFPDVAAGDSSFDFSIPAVSALVSRYSRLILYCDYLSLCIYIAVVLLIGVFLICGLCNIYRSWYCNSAQYAKKGKRNKYTFKQSGRIAALLARERNRYFSLPAYMTNTVCGFLFAAVFVMLILLMDSRIAPYIHQLAEYFQVATKEYDLLYIYAITIFVTLSSTTYASISIEGKQMDVMKALPVAAEDIFKAKILLHISMSVPIILILNTIMAVSLHWTWENVLLGYVMPLLYSFFIGITGYMINLIFPNFEWENVTHIVKQSIPAILSTLIGAFITCGSVYLILKYFSNALILGSFIACGIVLLLIGIIAFGLNMYGVILYKRL